MILTFGQSGQLARELAPLTGGACLSRAEVDFETPGAIADAIARHRPEAVINAVAFTDVDGAEDAKDRAFRVNEAAVGELAKAIPLVHLSTDYVFDGSGIRPWQPDDPTGPLNVYGHSKCAGEALLRAAQGPHVILRCSWVVSPHGRNFVKTMLQLGAERDALRIVADQIGAPTAAHDIAAAALSIVRQLKTAPEKSGTYHYQAKPHASWAEVAREIFDQAGITCAVTEIPSHAYPTPAQRPLNSRLDYSATEENFGLEMPDWRVSLKQILARLGHA